MAEFRTSDKSYTRDSDGLRDALFDAIEALRDGRIRAEDALAFAKLADKHLKLAAAERRARRVEERRLRLEQRY
jgi:hypothetical protein